MKSRKTVIVFVLLVVMLVSIYPQAAFATEPQKSDVEICADILNALGSFKGSDKGYELERAPKRIEASVMLVRLLGKEAEALECTIPHPFTDVPSWADGYVSYMYAEGLTNGVSSTLFGSSNECDVKMFVTFVLRALGFDDSKGDFTYNESITFGRMNSLLTGEDALRYAEKGFTRGDMAKISYNALFVELNNDDRLLLQKLYDDEAVEKETAERILNTLYAEDIIAIGDYNTFNYPYISYDVEVVSELSVDQYPSEAIRVDIKCAGQDLDTNPIVSLLYTYYLSDGSQEKLERYIADGYDHYIGYDGSKIKYVFDDDGDTGLEETDDLEGTIYTILDRYKDVRIEELEDGSVTVTLSFANSSAVAMEMASNDIANYWFNLEGLDETSYLILPTKCEKTYTVNADGELISDNETIEFSFFQDGNPIIFNFVSTTVTSYNNIGEPVTVTLPSDLDTYILQ